MHDIRAIRADPDAFDAALQRRGFPSMAHDLVEQDAALRSIVQRLQEQQAERNEIAREIGDLRRRGAETTDLEERAQGLRKSIDEALAGSEGLRERLNNILASIPNTLDDAVPDGADETGNMVMKQWAGPRDFGFKPRQHFELGEALGLMDFAGAAKLAGSRFTILRGGLARLERALGQFMIDLHTTEHGYEELSVPLLVNDAAVYGTSQLPKFADDLFKTTDGRWLIPTAEVPLTNLAAGEILPEARLPLRMTALTDCFRSEAGSAGKDTRGMLRQHQFKKVELVSICTPEQSAAEHERMVRCAETVLERLEIPYRRMLLCAGDTGFGSSKTFDLEVWLPGQQSWREISSCSNMRAFQARRMNARFRSASDARNIQPVHTLNGSGVAVGRALIAVMENYQQEDGSVVVPPVLRSRMGGVETLTPARANS
jgi:seryl-tRNA synthetase